MKIVLTAVSMLLVLVGCTSPDDDSAPTSTPTPTPEPTSSVSVPAPDPTQRTALLTEFDTIAPGITDDGDRAVDNARTLCAAILGGEQDLVESTRVRFAGGYELDDDEAQRIIDTVTDQPWCTK